MLLYDLTLTLYAQVLPYDLTLTLYAQVLLDIFAEKWFTSLFTGCLYEVINRVQLHGAEFRVTVCVRVRAKVTLKWIRLKNRVESNVRLAEPPSHPLRPLRLSPTPTQASQLP